MYSTSKTVLVSSIFTNALTKQKEQNKNRVLCSILFAFSEYIADKSEEDDAHAYVVHGATTTFAPPLPHMACFWDIKTWVVFS